MVHSDTVIAEVVNSTMSIHSTKVAVDQTLQKQFDDNMRPEPILKIAEQLKGKFTYDVHYWRRTPSFRLPAITTPNNSQNT